MRKELVLPLIGILSGLMLTGCQPDRGVYAGNDIYMPRPAPPRKPPEKRDVQGELVRVDLKKNDFVVRVENGMEQTFKFDDDTFVLGLSQPRGVVQNLVGKEGSELIVQWQEEEDGLKMANRVDVTQLSTSKAIRHRKH